MIRCPLCGRDVMPDGLPPGVVLLSGHDLHPNLRARCNASHHTVAEAEAMAAEKRRHRLNEPAVDE